MFRHLLFHPTTSIVNPNIGGKLHTTSSFNDFGMHSELEAEEIFTSSPAAMSTSPGPQSPTGALGGAAEVLSGPGSKSLQLGPGGAVVGGSNPSAKASAAPDVRDPLYPMRNPRAKNQLNHIHDSPTDGRSFYEILNQSDEQRKSGRVLTMADGARISK